MGKEEILKLTENLDVETYFKHFDDLFKDLLTARRDLETYKMPIMNIVDSKLVVHPRAIIEIAVRRNFMVKGGKQKCY